MARRTHIIHSLHFTSFIAFHSVAPPIRQLYGNFMFINQISGCVLVQHTRLPALLCPSKYLSHSMSARSCSGSIFFFSNFIYWRLDARQLYRSPGISDWPIKQAIADLRRGEFHANAFEYSSFHLHHLPYEIWDLKKFYSRVWTISIDSNRLFKLHWNPEHIISSDMQKDEKQIIKRHLLQYRSGPNATICNV